jgi:N-glycosylase/DNA lyase
MRRRRLAPKLWRVIKSNGAVATYDNEEDMQNLVATNAEVRIGVYELVEQYGAVKTVAFSIKKVAKKTRR